MGITFSNLEERLQCPRDADAQYDNTTWCNRDLIPIPVDRRTYGAWSYVGYWFVSGCSISAWSVGSTLLAYGLSPQQAIGVVILASFLVGLLAVSMGWVGGKYHIGFTVSSRFSWGMRGAYFPVILRVFVAIMWFGIQAFWGGQATRVMLGAIWPGLESMKNHFSASSHLETNDFIGLVVWVAAFLLALLIRPERLQIPFFVCWGLFCISCLGLLIWSVTNANGPGAMFHEPAKAPSLSWAFMFGITAILGAWGSGTLGQSDWTRYSVKQYSAVPSQFFATPLTISLTAILGIIVTSAARDVIGGEIMWNPIYLLASIQKYYHHSSAARAGVFFGALGVVASQFSISVVLNSIACGMDMAALCPRYINIRRGSYIMAALAITTQPWQLLSTAERFLQVLSGFGVFLAPVAGILLADFFVVRGQKLRINDLYIGNSSSVYWYQHGVNWRAPLVFFSVVWMLLPGLVATVDDIISSSFLGWVRLYNLTFIVGTAESFVLFILVNRMFPPKGLGESAAFYDTTVFSDGVSESERSNVQIIEHEKGTAEAPEVFEV